MEQTIEKDLREILSKHINLTVPNDNVKLEDGLEQIGVDSISFMKMVVAIELKYGFEFNDEDLIVENFLTVGHVINYISNRIKS